MAEGEEEAGPPRLSADVPIDSTAPPPDPFAGLGVGIPGGLETFDPHQDLFSFLGGSNPDFDAAENVYVNISGDGDDILGGAQTASNSQLGVVPGQTTLRAARDWWWNIDERQRAVWQRKLWAAGYMKDEPAAWGKLDPFGRDFKAWENAVNNAARLETPVDILLEDLINQDARESLYGSGSGSGGRRRPDIQLMGSGDASRLADEVGLELMGRELSREEKNRVIERLHAVQRSQQSAAIDVSATEAGGGTLTTPDSPRTVIESAIESDNPVEVKGKEQVDAFARFNQFFGG